MDLSPLVLRELIIRLLEEDVGYGDITTLATVPPEARGHGRFLAKEALVLAGLDVALAVFHTVDSDLFNEKLTAGRDGRATWKVPYPGNFSVYTSRVAKESGEHGGKKYEESLPISWKST